MADISISQITVDKNQIFLDKTFLQAISESVKDVPFFIKEDFSQRYKKIQEIAKNYINILQEKLKDINILLNSYKHLQQTLTYLNLKDEDTQDILNYISASEEFLKSSKDFDFKEIYKQLIIQTDIFTAKVQQVFGIDYKIAYIHQSKAANVVEVFVIDNIEDLIKLRKTSTNGIEQRLYQSRSGLQHLVEMHRAVQIDKSLYTIGKTQAEYLDLTYKKIIERYNGHRNHKKRLSLVLWDMESEWHLMKLYQKGDLAQTYAVFALTRYDSPFSSEGFAIPETNIETFMKEVEKVDAVGGVLQTDILNKQNNIGYAVKTLNAAPQGIKQSISTAKAILSGELDEKSLKDLFERKSEKGRNRIEKAVRTTAEQAIYDSVLTL